LPAPNPDPPMPAKRRRFCPECRRNVLAEETPFGIVGHACLSAVTCGLWLPFALVALVWHQFASGGYRCPDCGARCR
jgi:hypothetical protein